MSPNTWGKWPNEGNEKNENSEVLKNKKNQEENKFIKEFIEEQKREISNWDDYASILDELFLNGKISSDTMKKLELFKKSKESNTWSLDTDKNNTFENIKISDELNNAFKVNALWDYMRLKNNKQTVKNNLSKEFDFELGKIDADLNNQIDNLWFKSLSKLIWSKSKRKEFINATLKTKAPKQRELLFLSNANIPDAIKQKMEVFNEQINKYWIENLDKETLHEIDQYREVESMLYDLNNKWSNLKNFTGFIDALILAIFDLELLSKNEIDNLIENNTPHLTVSEARIKWILSDADIKWLKEGYLNLAKEDKLLQEIFWENIDENIKKIPSDIFDNFIIPTNFYTKTDLRKKEYIMKIWFEEFWEKLMNELIDVEKITQISKKELDDNIEKVISNKSITNRDKFQEWNFLIWNRIDPNTKINRVWYYAVTKIDEENNKIILTDKGSHNKYNANEKSTQEFSFNEYIEFLKEIEKNNNKWVNNHLTFIDDDTRKKMIREGSIEEDETTFELNSGIKIDEKQKIYRNKIEKQLESENKNSDEIHEYITTNEEYLNQVNKIKRVNLEYTKDKVDSADPDGKEYGFDIGTSFITDWEDGCVYTITNINIQGIIDWEEEPGTVDIIPENNWKKQTVGFKDFYKTFIDKKCKRKSNAKTDIDVYNDVKWKVKAWEKFSMKDWKIKKNESENNYNYNYLVSEKWKEFTKGCDMLQIHEFQWDKVSISLWKLVEKDKKDTESGKEETIYSMSSDTYTITVGALNTWIKNVDLEPHHKDEANDIKEDEIETLDRKWKFTSRIFARYSFWEMIAWWKLWLDTLESYLKEWNEEHSAKLAEGFMKWALPKELQVAFQSRLEWATRKRMDEQVEMLKNLDSGPATEMVYQWLINKDTPEYKKEAAMIFMVKWYGTLYTKKALYKHKWKFLWYEAMGWEVNDERYKKMKDRAEKDDVPFTEEALLYDLIAGQCKWFGKPARRGRLYKELEAIMWGWKTDEIEKWKKDAGKKRNCQPRVDFAIDELKWGSYPNAMWAFEQIVNKWNGWDLTLLNKVPFVMIFSWISYSFDQDLIDQFKNSPGAGRLVLSTFFASKVSMMDLYSKVVLQLSKDLLWDVAHAKAKKIFDKQKDSSSEIAKIEAADDFFKEYWDKLTSAMNFLNTGKTWENSEVENFILLKTREENKNEDWYDVYKQYQDVFFGVTQAEAKFDVPDYMMDAHYKWWMSWLNMYKVSSDVLKLNASSAFSKWEVATMYWEEIQEWIEAIWQRTYSENEESNRNDQEFLLVDKLRQLLAWIVLNQWWNKNQFMWIMNWPTSVFGAKFNKWGIKAEDFIENWLTYDQILDKKNPISNKLFKKYADNILDGKNNSMIKLQAVTAEDVADALKNDEQELDEDGYPINN